MSWIFGVNKDQTVPQNFEQIMAQGVNPGMIVLVLLLVYFLSLIHI